LHLHGDEYCLPHQADPVVRQGGVKYVLRTDVVYPFPPTTDGKKKMRWCMNKAEHS